MQRDFPKQLSSDFATAAKLWAKTEDGCKGMQIPTLGCSSEPNINQMRPFKTCSEAFNAPSESIEETRKRFKKFAKGENTLPLLCPVGSPKVQEYRQTLRAFWGSEERCDEIQELKVQEEEFQSYFKPTKSGKFCCPSMPPTFAPALIKPSWLNRPTEFSPFYPPPQGVKIKPISKGGIRTNFERNPYCLTCGAKRDVKISQFCKPTHPPCRRLNKHEHELGDMVMGHYANEMIHTVMNKIKCFSPFSTTLID